MGNLIGKRALVTGASRGIGAAIATAFAEEGADVAITYERSAEPAAEVVRAIEAKGRRGLAIQADSADAEAVKHSVDAASEAFGGLDILVNRPDYVTPDCYCLQERTFGLAPSRSSISTGINPISRHPTVKFCDQEFHAAMISRGRATKDGA